MITEAMFVALPKRIEFADEIAVHTPLTQAQIKAVSMCLTQGHAILALSAGKIIGGIGYMHAKVPDSHEDCLVERMLYVNKDHRGGPTAVSLLTALETYAHAEGCTTILAGSSLDHHEASRRLYEGMGYKTNLSFRKDL